MALYQRLMPEHSTNSTIEDRSWSMVMANCLYFNAWTSPIEETERVSEVVYFVNSGTEANELATLMARLYTSNLSMIGLGNAYHGGSAGTISLSALHTWKFLIPQGEIHHVMNPDPYHGAFGSDASRYAKEVEDHITYRTSEKLLDLLQKLFREWGGTVELAPGYLKLVYDTVRKAGGGCIVDEVKSGFGRTGSHYCGFEIQGEVVIIAEIAQVMSQKIQFNTFGGNPVCSAGGLEVLKVIDKEKRQSHCTEVGSHLIHRLTALQQKHEKQHFH